MRIGDRKAMEQKLTHWSKLAQEARETGRPEEANLAHKLLDAGLDMWEVQKQMEEKKDG